MTIKEKLIKAIEETDMTDKDFEEMLEEYNFGITIFFRQREDGNFELYFN